MFEDKIESTENGQAKELLKLMADAKPYVKKHDGYAVKIEEDKEVTYKDYDEKELTLKVPAGSYIITEGESCHPSIVTADEFEGNRKFVNGEKVKEVKKESGPKLGLALLSEEESE